MNVREGAGAVDETMAGTPAPSRPLGVRIAWITGKVDPIIASGKDRFGNVAMSIEDVENAIRPLLAEAGVVTRWSAVSDEHWKEGNEHIWKVLLHVTVESSDDPHDCFEADWSDTGSSLTAAHSFTVKGYYRRLFHLGDAAEEQVKTAGPTTKPKTVQQAVRQNVAAYGDPAATAPGTNSPSSQVVEPDPSPVSSRPGAFSYAATGRENPTQIEEEPDLDLLLSLAASLPQTPRDEAHVRKLLKTISFPSVLERVTRDHKLQCGSKCPHLVNALEMTLK